MQTGDHESLMCRREKSSGFAPPGPANASVAPPPDLLVGTTSSDRQRGAHHPSALLLHGRQLGDLTGAAVTDKAQRLRPDTTAGPPGVRLLRLDGRDVSPGSLSPH